MRPDDKKLMKWKLTRERFCIGVPDPPPVRRTEKRIGEILSGILEQHQQPDELPAILIECWPVIAGEQIAGHTRPARVKEQILYVYADHPGWLTEIRRFPKSHFLKKLAMVPGAPAVHDLRFVLDPAIRPGKRHKS